MLENSFNDVESKNQFFGCDNSFKNEISKTKEHIEEEELQEYEKSFIENFQDKESTKKLCKETELKKTKTSIKEKSPFTIIFRNLYKNLENEMSKFDDFSLNSNTDNNFYQQNLIEFLLEKFMPYCFIWASFSLRGLSFSRITNGIVEKYNQFTKKGVPKNILPHRYLLDVSDVIKGNCKLFLIEKKQNDKNMKSNKRILDIESDISDYEEEQLAHEHWFKPNPITLQDDRVGFQSKKDFVLINKNKNQKKTKLNNQTSKKAAKKKNQIDNIQNQNINNLTKVDLSPSNICFDENYPFSQDQFFLLEKPLIDSTNNYSQEISISEKKINLSIIEAYFSSIDRDKRSLVVSSQKGYEIIHNPGNIGKFFTKNDLSIYESLIFPFNKNGNHWCLFFASIKNGTVTYIDPLGENQQDFDFYFKNWCDFSSRRNDLNKIEWKKQSYCHSIQNDSINCGIYVCIFGAALINGSNYLQFDTSKESLIKHRISIKESLINNTVFGNKIDIETFLPNNTYRNIAKNGPHPYICNECEYDISHRMLVSYRVCSSVKCNVEGGERSQHLDININLEDKQFGLHSKMKEEIQIFYNQRIRKPMDICITLTTNQVNNGLHQGLKIPKASQIKYQILKLKNPDEENEYDLVINTLNDLMYKADAFYEPNQAFCFGCKLGDGSDTSHFIVNFTSFKLLESIKFNNLMVTDKLVFNLDATYKITKTRYPLVVIGRSDHNGTFFPVFVSLVSHEQTEDFIHIIKSLKELCLSLNISFMPTFFVQDACLASKNAI
ncbi:unnamed protein product [Brachionus calyciflorus]|uniref:Ubiquitin-like protease family profile domain-containing protein n=1 Tax=Brachionus calyciflorus TaxID=104777 RepID=A0A814II83_9BILA|nr:unnamed protein product [Brachionus calyciflorus]